MLIGTGMEACSGRDNPVNSLCPPHPAAVAQLNWPLWAQCLVDMHACLLLYSTRELNQPKFVPLCHTVLVATYDLSDWAAKHIGHLQLRALCWVTSLHAGDLSCCSFLANDSVLGSMVPQITTQLPAP